MPAAVKLKTPGRANVKSEKLAGMAKRTASHDLCIGLIIRHPKKDEHGEHTTTVIGIGLDAGRYLTPDKRKLQLFLSGVLS